MVNILKYNLHWKEDFRYHYEIKRDLFHEIYPYVDARQIIGVIGLRRTGKTVLLKQFIDHLITAGARRDRILYFSFDDGAVFIEDLIAEFQARMGVEIADAGRVYLFLDEIQKLAGWQNQVKYYYDTYPNLKFFVSGSSSLFLRRGVEESLAGRIFLFKLPVLSFAEFLRLKGEEDMVRKPEVFKESLKDQVLLYVRRQLPELVTADEPFIGMYMESIIDKIVYEDLPGIFPIEYVDALKRILGIVASHPGIITDYAALANDLGISRKTLSGYIYYLERGFLIQKCYNFSKNRLTSEKKMKSHARFFWRKGASEVDCVLSEGDSIIPIESKYKDDIRKKEIKGLLKFLKEFSLDTGYVVTKDMATEEEIDGKRITFIPLWKWLLQVSTIKDALAPVPKARVCP
jgi:predicted AAA+ superfamily ATPase